MGIWNICRRAKLAFVNYFYYLCTEGDIKPRMKRFDNYSKIHIVAPRGDERAIRLFVEELKRYIGAVDVFDDKNKDGISSSDKHIAVYWADGTGIVVKEWMKKQVMSIWRRRSDVLEFQRYSDLFLVISNGKIKVEMDRYGEGEIAGAMISDFLRPTKIRRLVELAHDAK